MAEPISIQFTRFSAFYSPLIATIAGGFLVEEGFEPTYSVAPVGASAIAGLLDGSVHMAQSAPSQGFVPLEKGEQSPVAHFAQINERDGFFITSRRNDPAFTWAQLAKGKTLVDHGGQPLVMFKYACARMGLDFDSLQAVDVSPDKMDRAFREGLGDYVHQQGPAPQQLEADAVGHIVARVGDAIGPVAFSSLAATRAWLRTDAAKRFMRAYRNARKWVIATPANEIARREASFFPDIDLGVLTKTIADYQALGCWSPHVEITRAAFEVTLDVYEHSRLITKRHPYEQVVAQPPG